MGIPRQNPMDMGLRFLNIKKKKHRKVYENSVVIISTKTSHFWLLQSPYFWLTTDAYRGWVFVLKSPIARPSFAAK